MKIIIAEYKYISGDPFGIDSDTIYGAIIDMANKLGYDVRNIIYDLYVSDIFYHDGKTFFIKCTGFFKSIYFKERIKTISYETVYDILENNRLKNIKEMKGLSKIFFVIKTNFNDIINIIKYIKRFGKARVSFLHAYEPNYEIRDFLKTLSKNLIIPSTFIPKNSYEEKLLKVYEIKRKVRKIREMFAEIFIIDSYSMVKERVEGKILSLEKYGIDSLIYGRAFWI